VPALSTSAELLGEVGGEAFGSVVEDEGAGRESGRGLHTVAQFDALSESNPAPGSLVLSICSREA